MGVNYSAVNEPSSSGIQALVPSPEPSSFFSRGDQRLSLLTTNSRGVQPMSLAAVEGHQEHGQDENASRVQERSPQALPCLYMSGSQSFSHTTQKFGALVGSPSTPSASMHRSNVVSPSSAMPSSGVFGPPSCATCSTLLTPLRAQYLEINGFPVGLENYGNTCYFNAVLQLLYHCAPLRMRMLELNAIYEKKRGSSRFDSNTVLALTAELFAKMHKMNNSKKRQKSVPTPRNLLNRVRQLNSIFSNHHQHDAHEFAMFLLNELVDTEVQLMSDENNRSLFTRDGGKESKASQWFSSLWNRRPKDGKRAVDISHCDVRGVQRPCSMGSCAELPRLISDGEVCAMRLPSLTRLKSSDFSDGCAGTSLYSTSGWDWGVPPSLQKILTGQFVSLMGCCECENVSITREAFIDIGLGVMQGSSLRRCVETLNATEIFDGENKMHCEHCNKKVVARRVMWINRLPEHALLIHLKRFHYDEKSGTMRKRNDHIALPREIDIVEYEPCGESAVGATTDASFCCGTEGSGSELQHPIPSSPMQSTLAGNTCSSGASDNDSGGTINCDDASSSTSLPTPKPRCRLLQKLDVAPRRRGRFALSGFVAHRGSGLASGHYFTCVRHGSAWRCFDDSNVTELSDREVQRFWGTPMELEEAVTTTTAYLLLYERVA